MMSRNIDFRKEVLNSRKPVLVEIWAEWCGACHIMTPIMKKLAKKYQNIVKFIKLDFNSNKDIEKKYGVNEPPMILFFNHGKLVDQISGMVPHSIIIEKINDLLQSEKGDINATQNKN